jgi:uncharacterized protein (TIGR02444 family)
LLALQDEHGQSVLLLLWAAWRRTLNAADVAEAVTVVREWDPIIGHLRAARRALKIEGPADSSRAELRDGVKALELDAERAVLALLERDPVAPAADLADALRTAADAWGSPPPTDALDALSGLLARAFPPSPSSGMSDAASRRVGPMSPEEEAEQAVLLASLADLRMQHQALEEALEDLVDGPGADQLQAARLKKRKLVLRDQIVILENRLTPDIIA